MSKYSSYILCLLISILVVVLYVNDFSPLVKLQWKIQDMLYSFRGDDNLSHDIVLVKIDDQTLETYGQWRWNRDRIADLLAAVGTGEPKTVLLDMYFEHSTEQDTMGYTEILAGQMSWMKNVIIPYEITPAEFRGQRISNPQYLKKFTVNIESDLGLLDENATMLARKVFLPPDRICDYSAGLGFKHNKYDSDRNIRWTPLVSYFEGYYYPSAELLAAAHQKGIDPSMITIVGGDRIRLGGQEIPTNDRAELFINFSKPGKSFLEISAADILGEKIDFKKFKNKLIIIAVTAESETDYYRTPVSQRLTSAEKTANIVENILHSNYMTRMDSSPGLDMIILFGLGIIFAFILPRVSLLYRCVILMISFFVLANVSFVLFNSYKILIKPLYLGLELFLLLLASPILDREFLAGLSIFGDRDDGTPKVAKLPKIDMDETGSEQESSRHREKARIPKDSPGNEPARQEEFEKTVAAQTPTGSEAEATVKAALPSDYKAPAPSDDRAKSEASLPAEEISVTDSASPVAMPSEEVSPPEKQVEDSPVIKDDSQKLKNLGRYRVVGTLGQGAMGKVYKGIDPAINRNVALKTIRLDFVSDPEELAELKERLFREARAAGVLSHPNIVTIYDVGTEKSLQYIAMEYLEGQTLEDMIRRKAKFNYRIIAQMISQICSALEYAHNQGIVHRDIKPANIMVLRDYVVKVMDFGIARIDSTSMTRTGIAMGTPNYISPEQLQGKHIDNRCDIFSLGVVMYELLVGKRPFLGENLTSLIYNIVNKDPELPSTVDNSVPALFDRVVERALKKNPDERFQRASEIAAALIDFIDSFSSKRTPV